jgi:hypothetical protein
MLDLEKLSQDDLDKVQSLYEELAAKARQGVGHGKAATGTPSIHGEISKRDGNQKVHQ